MTDPPAGPAPSHETGDGAGSEPGPEATVGPPRWVKVFGILTLVLVVLLLVGMLAGGGDHGPGRHMP